MGGNSNNIDSNNTDTNDSNITTTTNNNNNVTNTSGCYLYANFIILLYDQHTFCSGSQYQTSSNFIMSDLFVDSNHRNLAAWKTTLHDFIIMLFTVEFQVGCGFKPRSPRKLSILTSPSGLIYSWFPTNCDPLGDLQLRGIFLWHDSDVPLIQPCIIENYMNRHSFEDMDPVVPLRTCDS